MQCDIETGFLGDKVRNVYIKISAVTMTISILTVILFILTEWNRLPRSNQCVST